jgi:hypothetical protein
MVAKSTRLGPGTLTLTPVTPGVPFDASCQLENAVISWDKDADDSITVLCGDVVAGAVRYTATLSGTLLQDLEDEAGLVAFTWENKGQTVAFEFTPNTVAGASVTGDLTIDPLDVGTTEEYGTVMDSDFEWDCVGEPVLAWGGVAAAEAEPEPALA